MQKSEKRPIRTCLSFYDLQKHGLVLPLIQFPFALNLLEDISTDNRGSFHNQSDEDVCCILYMQMRILFFKAPLPFQCPYCNRCSAYFLCANRNLVLQGIPSPPIIAPIAYFYMFFFANRNLVLHPHPSHCCPNCILLHTFYLQIGILFCSPSPPIAPIAVALSSSVIPITAPGQLPLRSLRPLIALICLHHQSCSIM